MRRLLFIDSLKTLLTIIAVIIAIIATSSCKDEKKNYVEDIKDARESYTMFTRDVETFISDSGITRYHISAPIWYIYDEAVVPRWTFPEGLFLEQYDNLFRQSAKVNCDSATYFSKKRLWRLDGNVVMVNVARDSFLTKQLFWDQYAKRIYSDTAFIRIVSKDRTIEGYGFSSNEHMTDYLIKKPTAIFPARNLRKSMGGDSANNAPMTITPSPSATQPQGASSPKETSSPRNKGNLKMSTVDQDAIYD